MLFSIGISVRVLIALTLVDFTIEQWPSSSGMVLCHHSGTRHSSAMARAFQPVSTPSSEGLPLRIRCSFWPLASVLALACCVFLEKSYPSHQMSESSLGEGLF